MNFDPNMMDPKMMKGFMESLSGMSDDEISMMMKSMGKCIKLIELNITKFLYCKCFLKGVY
jgi:hypothetical protein